MPLIRYRTGDITEGLNLEPCRCGRTSPRIKKLVGRIGDIPRIKGTLVVPELIADTIGMHDGLGRFQMIVERSGFADRLTIRVESSRPKTDSRSTKRLLEDIRAATLIRPEIEIVPKGSIDSRSPIVIDHRFSSSAP